METIKKVVGTENLPEPVSNSPKRGFLTITDLCRWLYLLFTIHVKEFSLEVQIYGNGTQTHGTGIADDPWHR